MRKPKPTIIDVETFGIEGRPSYPPHPVGVAVKEWGKRARYFGFGHVVPEDLALRDRWTWNNSTWEEASAHLAKAYANPDGICMHNAKFDLEVIEQHFGLAMPPWQRIHDTMFLLFLQDPNAIRIDLKSSAERLLGTKPEERDELNDWLTAKQPVPGVRISTSLKGKNPPGAYIAYAPTQVVGPYACGDVDRTYDIFKLLHGELDEKMQAAYDRERRLLLVLLDMEKRGVAVDVPILERDIRAYRGLQEALEGWVRQRLGADPAVNLDSGQQLIGALDRAGLVDLSKLGVTKTGRPSSDKAAIKAAVSDLQLANTLQYLAQLKTCLGTFMEPWLETARKSKGLIYTQWHQTRGGGGGARTGRLSSSPNFQNIPVEFKPLFGAAPLPAAPVGDLLDLPQVRRYIRAYPGQVLAGRDFSGQELRILAHFEDGAMLQAYQDNPGIDFHQHAADLMHSTAGVNINRRDAKTLNFSLLYGAGLTNLARQLGCTVEKAKTFLEAYYRAFPGIRKLQDALKFRARSNQPVRTTGGRLYYCEDPEVIDGRMFTYEYKMCNTIIQGSAADQTKEAMCRFFEAAGPGKLILSVHDEIVISVPGKERATMMEILAEAMDKVGDIDVPIRSDGEFGYNFSHMGSKLKRMDDPKIDRDKSLWAQRYKAGETKAGQVSH